MVCTCDACNYSTKRQYDLNKHFETKKHIDKVQGIKKNCCEHCSIQFKWRSGYTRHMTNFHTDNKNSLTPGCPVSSEAAQKTQISSEGLASPERTPIENKNNLKWYDVDPDEKLIISYVRGTLLGHFNHTKRKSANEDLSGTKKNTKKRFIKNWDDLKKSIDNIYDEATNWEVFLELFEYVIIYIKSYLYASLYEKLSNDHRYKHLICIFKELKVMLSEVMLSKGKCDKWNNQNTLLMIEKMDQF